MLIENYLKALANETRLRLLYLSLHHELNVNEIVEIMGMGQSRISRHLKILSDSGILSYRQDGLWTFYTAIKQGKPYQLAKSLQYFFRTEPIFSADLINAQKVIENRARSTTKFFDTIAEDWESLKRNIIGNFDLKGLILQYVDPTRTIVDLGCGNGDLLPYLLSCGDHIIGVDKSPKMLQAALNRLHRKGHSVDLRLGDIEHLPLKDGEADLCVINMVLHHLPSPSTAFKEIYRVLKSNGKLIIADLLKHRQESLRMRYGDRWLGFSKKEINNWLRENEFNHIRGEDFSLKHDLRGFILSAEKETKGGQHEDTGT